MHSSQPPASPDPSTPLTPVICDRCRAAGMAGDEAFSAIPDILAFAPVPRRAHANGWTAQHQRAFIAALAITGSPRQAARAIGRHQFGAEQLRTAKGGKAFAAAWDAAMELARERETHRIHDNLAELAREREGQLASIGAHPGLVEGPAGGPPHPDCDYDPDLHTDDYPEYWEAKRSIRQKLIGCRRLLLMLISGDPERRRAWEVLVGPVDWERAERMEAQDDEPVPDPERNPHGMPSMHRPDMVLTVEAGLLPEFTGGRDALAEIRAEVGRLKAADEPRQRREAPVRASDPETVAMLNAIAAAREAHPEDFD